MGTSVSPWSQVHAQGLAFAKQHQAVLTRILSDRSQHAHLSDLAELEAGAYTRSR
jgi:hypothetical protein